MTEMEEIAEYRELLKDQTSTDGAILKRLEFLKAFCRNIIRLELDKFKETK